ncbi:10658_t:CDS:2, partial [Cetraspora pellucida]
MITIVLDNCHSSRNSQDFDLRDELPHNDTMISVIFHIILDIVVIQYFR